MSDNEKLIEEAAKAIWKTRLVVVDDDLWERLDGSKSDYMREARAAFAVFEKAHAPTRMVIQITPEAIQREYELRNPAPTDAQVDAALDAYFAGPSGEPTRVSMRAALRAAAVATEQGENR